jgi:hypothetical protein
MTAWGYPVHVSAAAGVPARAPRHARPHRGVLVIRNLDDLRGPATGAVELPLRLFWSAPDRVFDLGDRAATQSMYQKVLREASRAEELTSYLNRGILVAVWPELYLPEAVRRAWESAHPALAAARAAAAA